MDLVWLLKLRFRNETVNLTSWNTDVAINFEDTLIDVGMGAALHEFSAGGGLTDLTFDGASSNKLPRSALNLDFVDVEREWSNRFDAGYIQAQVGLWSCEHSISGGAAQFTEPKTRYKGKCVQASDVPGNGVIYVRAKYVGSLQQITATSPVRCTDSQQRALDPDDNLMEHVARSSFLQWGGKP